MMSHCHCAMMMNDDDEDATKYSDHAVMHLQIIAEKGHHYKPLEVDSNVINIRLCCFDAQQMQFNYYCLTNLPMSLKISHYWQMKTQP